jgi:SAM-dependent methyltransferase
MNQHASPFAMDGATAARNPIPACRFCGCELRHTFTDLGMSPLCETFLRADELGGAETFYPLRVFVCDSCFLVQLPEFVSPEAIFSEYAYFSSYSDSWLLHAKTYVGEMIDRFKLDRDCLVVELASNDGYLLQYFVANGIPVLGIEPAANVAIEAEKKGVPSLVSFFGLELARELAEQGKKADLIAANNVLAHVPDLRGFVAGMKVLLKPQGVITVEFPHLMRLMEGNQFDTIYHEHFCYFSFLTFSQVLSSFGLVIFDVEELPTHGGSLRIYACHDGDATHPVTDRVVGMVSREVSAGFRRVDTYCPFDEQVKRCKRNILRFLVDAKEAGKSVVGYGAPGKGNTFLNYCGLRGDFIDYTVDRNPYKHGKFLPGTHIPVHTPEKLRETRPDYILVLPWNLKEEIASQLSFVREWGGKLVVAIPNVEVID